MSKKVNIKTTTMSELLAIANVGVRLNCCLQNISEGEYGTSINKLNVETWLKHHKPDRVAGARKMGAKSWQILSAALIKHVGFVAWKNWIRSADVAWGCKQMLGDRYFYAAFPISDVALHKQLIKQGHKECLISPNEFKKLRSLVNKLSNFLDSIAPDEDRTIS